MTCKCAGQVPTSRNQRRVRLQMFPSRHLSAGEYHLGTIREHVLVRSTSVRSSPAEHDESRRRDCHHRNATKRPGSASLTAVKNPPAFASDIQDVGATGPVFLPRAIHLDTDRYPVPVHRQEVNPVERCRRSLWQGRGGASRVPVSVASFISVVRSQRSSNCRRPPSALVRAAQVAHGQGRNTRALFAGRDPVALKHSILGFQRTGRAVDGLPQGCPAIAFLEHRRSSAVPEFRITIHEVP